MADMLLTTLERIFCMTVIMDAPRTGEIQITSSGTPKTDLIVKELAGNVWELLCAGEMSAALVLLRAKGPAFEQVWREEYVGLPPEQATEDPTPVRNCTSMSHTLLGCAQALAEGALPEGQPFCDYCTQQQLAMQEAPQKVEEGSGKIVHVLTPTGRMDVQIAS